MNKVLVIGCPGAGKSTFARYLREATGLPLYYLDRIWHRADRTNVSREEFDERLGEILSGRQWIIDGNYLRTMQMRMEACDTIFLLDYPLEVCLSGVQSRIGKEREDMPWIEQEFDAEFRQWIAAFEKDQLPEIYRLLEQYKKEKTVIIFHSREEAQQYAESGGPSV
ncbi:adenylate kinase [Parablautia sp. Marseille-Q6255]|uniref:adenylate kinase n=1 Tax=Parablautia sp. Marseille-Q6255 TaxID=3039593 RepID=UPI0024BCCBB3|nr:adenylate kinase [Parablautia sp. Marseille-Q6255]